MMAAVRTAGRSVLWYLKELSGEAKWDEYLEACRQGGVEPMSRRAFERHRSEHAERHPQSRCC